MIRICTPCIITLLLFLSLSVFGQDQKDYRILLNSGNFIPVENTQLFSKSPALFGESAFHGNYYLVIQFRSLPNDDLKKELIASGIRLIDYIPNYAYTASINTNFNNNILSTANVRSIFQFKPEQKTTPALLKGNVPLHAMKVNGYADVTVISYERLDVETVKNSMAEIAATVVEEMPTFRSFTIRVPRKNLAKLIAMPFIQWVEPIDAPYQKENLLGRSLHRVNVLNDGVRNLKGDGINVGIWDAGEISPHIDFLPAGRLTQVESGTIESHSTHCSGTILGRGLIDPRARGMAPNAKLFSYDFDGNIQTEMAAAIPANNLIVSSHSYGSTQTCGVNGNAVSYSATSRATDLNLNNFPFHLHVHSSGNSQSSCTGGWSTITSSGKTAKNNILVANITSAEALSGSSSCGPVQDGRVKPEISSFGTNVFSTYTPLNSYGTISGTSMATPGVAGTVALLVERYKQLNSNTLPPSALIKNTICNTAADLGVAGPDYRFGFGRINALAAVRILEENRYVINTASTGDIRDISINVPAGTSRLRVMVSWNDPAGTANANPALVNNLDLTVVNGSTVSLPWILDPLIPANAASRGIDNVSNIEQVTIDAPAAGTFILRVTGTAIPVGPQEYTLTWSVEQPSIEVTYPNGDETFNPGSSETITWNNTGISSAQLVEYSVDNGNNWNTISGSVPASTTRLVWSVPAGLNTSQALIRITSGSITDQSDVNFKILGTVSSLSTNASSCTSGQLIFNWPAVLNATNYDLYFLDVAVGAWAILAANVSGTTFTANGLVPNSSMWFTIVAKNSSTGSVSSRAVAINRTIPNTGLSVIGPITGPTNFCGAASNVAYSLPAVTGATNYTWSVPAGASIMSGQGTSNLIVNYPPGSSSGNVTVFGSAGSCLTSLATLSIAIGGTSITAPVSGGDQTQVNCSPNPIPTLTASATAATGNNVIWYDAQLGGNIISSPILNSIGTITYYAASYDPIAGCESINRTAITLTINAAPAATITAGGPISFCEGANVVLTASTGNGYLWSNSETTQSIIVTTAGTYTVTVDQGNGCTSFSIPTIVTVNQKPVPLITASGPVRFCEGGSVILTASPSNSYLWSNSATTSSITVDSPGSYSVAVIDINGCNGGSAVTSVEVAAKPNVSISASPFTKLYPGLSTTLTALVSPAASYNYTWYKNGIILNNESLPTLTVSFDGHGLGDYSVMVSNADGCNNISTLRAIDDSITSKLFVYPNPNNGQFEVSYHSTSTGNILTIYDSKGARVYSKSFITSSPYQLMHVDLRSHSKGTYTIMLSGKEGKKIAAAKVVLLL